MSNRYQQSEQNLVTPEPPVLTYDVITFQQNTSELYMLVVLLRPNLFCICQCHVHELVEALQTPRREADGQSLIQSIYTIDTCSARYLR